MHFSQTPVKQDNNEYIMGKKVTYNFFFVIFNNVFVVSNKAITKEHIKTNRQKNIKLTGFFISSNSSRITAAFVDFFKYFKINRPFGKLKSFYTYYSL